MQGFNKVVIAGNLTRDPEGRFLPNGTAICQFGLAINRSWTQDGQKREECTFVDVSSFGKTAELITKYVQKGNPILLEGRLKLEQWDDKQTQQKRSKLTVVAESVTFLGGGDRQQSPENQQQPRQQQRPPQRQQAPPEPPVDDDEIPF